MRSLILSLVLLPVLCLSAGASGQVRVFELQHRRADTLVEKLAILAGDSVRLAASGTRVVATGPPDSLKRVAELVAALDQAQMQWLIRVRQEKSVVSDSTDIGRSGARNTIGYRLGNLSSVNEQTLRIVDGTTGFVSVGRNEPFVRRFAAFVGETSGFAETLDYRRVRTGFTVRPRAVGDTVELELVPTLEQIVGQGRGKRVQFNRSATTFRVTPGEWIDIGQFYSQNGGVGLALLSYRAGNLEKHYRLKVRVDPAH